MSGGNAGAIRAGKAEVELALKERISKGLEAAKAKLKGFHAFLATTEVNGFGLLKSGMGGVLGIVKKVGLGVTGLAGSLLGAAKIFAETDRRILSPEEAKAADKMRIALSGITQSTQKTVAALVMQLTPSIQAVIDIIRLVMQSIKKWINENKALFDSFNQVMTGIRDALMAGDMRMAAEILWAGLKVAWSAGIAALAEPWAAWKTSFQQTANDAFHGFQLIFHDVWAKFDASIINVTTAFERAWQHVLNWFRGAWAKATEGVSKSLVFLQEKLGIISKKEADLRRRDITKAKDDSFAEADEKRNKALAKIESDRQKMLARTEKERKASEDRIAQNNIDSNKLIAEANERGIEEAKRNLEAQKANLKKLTDEARDKAKKSGNKLDTVFDLKSQMSTVGTFDAAGIRGLSGTKPLSKVEENTKKTAEQLEAANKKLEGIEKKEFGVRVRA